jgi:hypothetical protein
MVGRRLDVMLRSRGVEHEARAVPVGKDIQNDTEGRPWGWRMFGE